MILKHRADPDVDVLNCGAGSSSASSSGAGNEAEAESETSNVGDITGVVDTVTGTVGGLVPSQ